MHSSQIERSLLRALIDNPALARQLVPVIDAELFEYGASAVLFTFIAAGWMKYQTVPAFSALRLCNDAERGHNEATFKEVDALIGALESMTPIDSSQTAILLPDYEEWIRTRKQFALLRRLIAAHENGADPRPLVDDLKAAYDWNLSTVQSGRFTFNDRDTLLNSAAAPFFVQDLIVEQSSVALVGAPGSNKTFLALDLALSVATGQRAWLNRRLNLSGPVVYVLGEGVGRFKLRVRAWEQEHDITEGYPFYSVNEAVQLTNRREADAFVREVAALKPVLIVFDTLSRCLAGADENNQKDMSAAVNVCDRLRQQIGCTVLLLHHTTKNGETERGSSVLRGAVDSLFLIKVDTSDSAFTLLCDKQKDAEPFAPINLLRKQVTLASERDPNTGEPQWSCVVNVVPPTTATQRADMLLWKARNFLLKNPGASKGTLADHLGGRRAERLRQISDWAASGEIRLNRKRQTSPLDDLKAEVPLGVH